MCRRDQAGGGELGRVPLLSCTTALQTSMNRSLYYLCLLLFVIGIGLLTAAAGHEVGGVEIFDDPPWILGVALTTIGGLIDAAYRQKQRVN